MPDYITTEALRKALGGVSEQTIRMWTRSGTLPQPVRMNSRFYLWPRQEIEELLASRRQPMQKAA